MPLKIFADGDRPSAAEFNRYFMQQQFVIKTSSTSRANAATLTADPHLTMSVVANTDYFVTGYLFYNGQTQTAGVGDFQMIFSAPAGSSFDWIYDGLPVTTADANGGIDTISRTRNVLGSAPTAGTIGTSFPLTVLIKGILRVSTTSGDLVFRWGQNTSSSTATTLLINSMLVARRLTT